MEDNLIVYGVFIKDNEEEPALRYVASSATEAQEIREEYQTEDNFVFIKKIRLTGDEENV